MLIRKWCKLSTAILTVLTIAAGIAAALNYQQIHRFRLPDDGVTWGDQARQDGRSRVVALRVVPNGPADRAGIRVNDVLESIQAAPIADTSDVPRRLAYVGAWAKAAYVVRRVSTISGTEVDVPASVIVGEAARGSIAYHRLPAVTMVGSWPTSLSGLFQCISAAEALTRHAAFLYFLPRFVYLFLLPPHR